MSDRDDRPDRPAATGVAEPEPFLGRDPDAPASPADDGARRTGRPVSPGDPDRPADPVRTAATVEPRDRLAGEPVPAETRSGTEAEAAAERRSDVAPAPPTSGEPVPAPPAGSDWVSLFSDEERRRLHARWRELQSGFVDDPRDAVARADELVQETIRTLHETFQRERRAFEGIWSGGEEVSTEDLRLAVQRYRSFFERLLAV